MLYFKAMPNSIYFYKVTFLHVIPVRITVPCLNQQTLRKTSRVHCFHTQLTKNCLVEHFLFSMKNSLDTQTRFWVDDEWNRPYVHLKFTLKYLCSRWMARYTLANTTFEVC